MLDSASPELAKNAEVIAARSSLDLAEQSASVGPVDDLAARLAADPNDHEARFDLAMAYYASGKREEAVEELLELVRRDREWNDNRPASSS